MSGTAKDPLDRETLLAAYFDGELDPDSRAEVEAWLDRDPEAVERLAALQRDNAVLRETLAPLIDEAVPAILLRRIEAAAAGQRRASSTPGADARADKGAASRRSHWQPWALAASLALLLAGLPAVWFWSAEESRRTLAEAEARESQARAVLDAEVETALQQALEGTVSGEALPWSMAVEVRGESLATDGEILLVRTYKSASGAWCREYRMEGEVAGTPFDERGIACRDEAGNWDRKVLFLDDPPAPAQGDPT